MNRLQRLYRAAFDDGEAVTVIDDEDRVHWGKLKTSDAGAELARPGRRRVVIPWDEVRFICHQGARVDKLKGADGSAAIEQLDDYDLLRLHDDLRLELKHRGRRMGLVFGDPFRVEGEARIFNAGNKGPAYYDSEAAEAIALEVSGGGTAILWDVETIFQAEGFGVGAAA